MYDVLLLLVKKKVSVTIQHVILNNSNLL